MAHENAKRKLQGVALGSISKPRLIARPTAPKEQTDSLALHSPPLQTPVPASVAAKPILSALAGASPESSLFKANLPETNFQSHNAVNFFHMSYGGMDRKNVDKELDNFPDGRRGGEENIGLSFEVFSS